MQTEIHMFYYIPPVSYWSNITDTTRVLKAYMYIIKTFYPLDPHY